MRNPLIALGTAALGGVLIFTLAGTLLWNVASDSWELMVETIHGEAPAAAPARPAHRAPLPPALAQPAPPPASAGPFVVRSILDIPGPIRFGQFYWDESKGEPGPVVITVDLTARTLSVFRNGHEIGATAILKGYGTKPTPLGVFPITEKDAHHVSNIYDAPMPYMLRLTNDGVSIHGSKVEKGYATNGCVGVPEEFAKKLFGVTHVGDRVIITDGRRMKLGDTIVKNPA